MHGNLLWGLWCGACIGGCIVGMDGGGNVAGRETAESKQRTGGWLGDGAWLGVRRIMHYGRERKNQG